jgi:hypothetical protein
MLILHYYEKTVDFWLKIKHSNIRMSKSVFRIRIPRILKFYDPKIWLQIRILPTPSKIVRKTLITTVL